eukprot:6289833-Ditylum_brightwellii.AAC.1
MYVVLAYRAAQEDNDDTHTAFIQQYRIMRSRGEENPKPQKQWYKDLAIEIKKWKKEGEVLLPTDANSTLNEPEFGNSLAEIRLFDVLGKMHEMGGINSHINSTKRITYALGTY